jgi:hypothetical protein
MIIAAPRPTVNKSVFAEFIMDSELIDLTLASS